MNASKPPASRRRLAAPLFCAALLVGGCHDERMEIVGLEWERTVQIERSARETALAWREQLPAEATAVACSPASRRGARPPRAERRPLAVRGQRGELVQTRQVWELESDQAQWCQYESRRWAIARAERTGGTGAARVWPAVALGSGEREGARSERCRVVLRSRAGQQLSFEPDCETWSRLEVGNRRAVELERGRVVRLLP